MAVWQGEDEALRVGETVAVWQGEDEALRVEEREGVPLTHTLGDMEPQCVLEALSIPLTELQEEGDCVGDTETHPELEGE